MGVATFGRAKAAVVRENAKAAATEMTGEPPAPAPAEPPVPGTKLTGTLTSTEVAIVDDGVDVPALRGGGLTEVRGLEGEWSSRDAAIPQLAIGQRMSKSLEEHPEFLGKFVYDKTEELGDKLGVIVTRMRKYYLDNTEYGSGEIPNRYANMTEVRAAGQVGNVVDVVDVDMLVAAVNDHQYERCTFTDSEDHGYYPVRMTVRGGNLLSFVGVVVRDLAGWLKGCMETGFYEIRSVKKTNAKGTWYAVAAKAAGKVPEDLVNQIRLAYPGDDEE